MKNAKDDLAELAKPVIEFVSEKIKSMSDDPEKQVSLAKDLSLTLGDQPCSKHLEPESETVLKQISKEVKSQITQIAENANKTGQAKDKMSGKLLVYVRMELLFHCAKANIGKLKKRLNTPEGPIETKTSMALIVAKT